MRRLLPIAAAVLLLTGCASGGTTYETPSQLHKAYVAAGGECEDPADVPESMIGEGAHALLCGEDVTMLVVFDEPEQAKRYVASTVDGDLIKRAIVGERWVVTSENGDLAAALGGRVVEG